MKGALGTEDATSQKDKCVKEKRYRKENQFTRERGKRTRECKP